MTKVTRRTTVAGIAALVLGTGALATTTQETAAEPLTIDGFDVADVTHDTPDGMVSDVIANVTAEYGLEATTEVTDIDMALRAGRDDPDSNTSEIAVGTEQVDATDATGTVTLSGPITYATAFEIADFRPSEAGASVVVPVRFELVAEAVDAGGSVLAEATAETTAEVTVTQEEDVLTFEVGGTGSIEIDG